MLRFNQTTAVAFSDILGFGLCFGDCGLGRVLLLLEGHGLVLGLALGVAALLTSLLTLARLIFRTSQSVHQSCSP